MPSPTGPSATDEPPSLRLLGEPALHRPGMPPLPLKDRNAALLAKLALDGPQPRALLCALLWPDKDAHGAEQNLRKLASRLAALAGGRKLVELGAPVRLEPGLVVDAADPAALPPAQLLAAGPLLAGLEFGAHEELDRWLQHARERVAAACAEALATHAEALEQAQRLHEALAFARRVAELAPLSEHAARRLMRLHYLRDDRAAAQDAYWQLAGAMRDELGVRPGPETLQLLQTIEHAAAAAPARPRPVPPSVQRPPVLVGRDAAWAAMADAWERDQPFLVIGEGGLGKSRLLDEFVRGVEGCVRARAQAGDEDSPLSLLGRMLNEVDGRFAPALAAAARAELARVHPAFGTAPSAAPETRLVRLAATQLLAAALSAGLRSIVLDDLHHADAATIEMLQWLAHSPSLSRLRWGLAARPGDEGRLMAPLARWLQASHRPVPVMLEPLSPSELSTLLASLGLPGLIDADIASQLHRHAGGHPFYTLATLRDALARGAVLRGSALPQPSSVHALLDARLRRFAPEVQDVLRVAAVAGPDLRADRVARLLGREMLGITDAWQVLEQAGVLDGEAFSHDLMHESALRSVPRGVRQALHRRFAGLLAGEAGARPADVARHFESGEAWGDAARHWQLAARRARDSGCLPEEVALFERAARCFERAGEPAARFDALHARLDSLQRRLGGAGVLAALPEVEALADTARRRLLCRLARAEAWIDREDEAALAETEGAVAEVHEHADLLADGFTLHAQALAQAARHCDAQQAAGRARAAADASGSVTQRLRALHASSYVAYAEGRLPEAVDWERQCIALAESTGDRSEAAASAGHVAAMLAAIGDVRATHAQALLAARCHDSVGLAADSTFGIVNAIILGTAAAALGRFDEAVDALEGAVAAAGPEAAPAAQAKARVALAAVRLVLGKTADAHALLADLPTATPPGLQMQAWLMRARAAEQAGRSPARELARLAEIDRTQVALPLVRSAHFEASYQGEPAGMHARLDAVRRECEALGLAGTARAVRWRQLVHALRRQGDAALEAARAHAALLEAGMSQGLSAKCCPSQVWATLAVAWQRCGDPAGQRRCADEARGWLEQALRSVPPALRDGFVKVNRVNREVLAGRLEEVPWLI